MKPKYKRLVSFSIYTALILLGFFLLFQGLEDYLVYYVEPSKIDSAPKDKSLRVGGFVQKDSWNQSAKSFVITDHLKEINVVYLSPPPPLFKENQGAIIEGTWDGKLFHAKRIFVKHDENYFPKEVVENLKKSGQWKGPQ